MKRLRSWRFSLRGLMLLLLVTALPCAWYADRLRRQRMEREAIAASIRQQHVVMYIFNQEWAFNPQPGVPPGSIPPKLPDYMLRQGDRGKSWVMTSRTELNPEAVAPNKLAWQEVRIEGGWDGEGVRPILVEVSGFEGESQFVPHLRAAFEKEGWRYKVDLLTE